MDLGVGKNTRDQTEVIATGTNIYINLHCIFVRGHVYLCSTGVYGMFTCFVGVVGVS